MLATIQSLHPTFSTGWLIFSTPLYFGLAHLHHALETYRQGGYTQRAKRVAIMSSSTYSLMHWRDHQPYNLDILLYLVGMPTFCFCAQVRPCSIHTDPRHHDGSAHRTYFLQQYGFAQHTINGEGVAANCGSGMSHTRRVDLHRWPFPSHTVAIYVHHHAQSHK